MTIKEIMKIGTKGMNTAQKKEEQERRINVSIRINQIQAKRLACEQEVKKCAKGSPAAKLLNGRIRNYNRELNKIKADESIWLREAAWFMYA